MKKQRQNIARCARHGAIILAQHNTGIAATLRGAIIKIWRVFVAGARQSNAQAWRKSKQSCDGRMSTAAMGDLYTPTSAYMTSFLGHATSTWRKRKRALVCMASLKQTDAARI